MTLAERNTSFYLHARPTDTTLLAQHVVRSCETGLATMDRRGFSGTVESKGYHNVHTCDGD